MAHILIVEDDSYHLELLAEIIKFGMHTPFSASNSDKALKILQQQKIDLIITDISLTNENGLDFIARLKSQNINIPFIVISGSTSTADRQKAEKMKAISFIKKPVDPEEVLKILNTI